MPLATLGDKIDVLEIISGAVALTLLESKGTVEKAIIRAEEELRKKDQKNKVITLVSIDTIVRETWDEKRAYYQSQGILPLDPAIN